MKHKAEGKSTTIWRTGAEEEKRDQVFWQLPAVNLVWAETTLASLYKTIWTSTYTHPQFACFAHAPSEMQSTAASGRDRAQVLRAEII